MRVLVSDQLEQSCIDILSREQWQVDNRPGLPADELKRVIPEYDVLIVRSATKVTAEMIGRGDRLRIIGRAGTGVDNIDVDAATRRGILVMNTPGGNTVSAAEHTISMMLSLARNIPQAHMSLTRGEWERKRFTGTEVFGKTVGIVGLGKIGREVAQRCMGLGMTVIGYDPVLSADAAGKLGIETVNLDDLYRRADVITVHAPLSDETRGLLNDASLARCKKGVRIVNCARGGIVDEAALLRALESGHVAGAALDVFEKEPPAGSPLLSHPHVIVTPHLGASTEEAQEKVAIQIAHAVVDAIHGRAFAGVVNSAVMALTLKEEVRPWLQLAERLGSLVAQLGSGKLRKLTVGAAGDTTVASLELLKAGVLKGILARFIPEPVNFINAPALAAEMGMTVAERREPETHIFAALLSVTYEGTEGKRSAAGTVIGRDGVRLVGLDGFRFEVRPEGHLLIYSNLDRPGVLARVGTILARHNVNIAGVSLGRSTAGGNALTVMNLDDRIPEAGVAELLTLQEVTNLTPVILE